MEQAITLTEQFFNSMGVASKLSDYQLAQSHIDAVIDKLNEHGMTALGEHQDISPEDVRQILNLAL